MYRSTQYICSKIISPRQLKDNRKEILSSLPRTALHNRIETKLGGKSRLLRNEGQKGFQAVSPSYSWPKDKLTKNSIICIIDDQFC